MRRGTNWGGLAVLTAAGLGAGMMLGTLAGEYAVGGTSPGGVLRGYAMPAHVVERDARGGRSGALPVATRIDAGVPTPDPALS